MATTAPVDFDVQYLRDQVMTTYDRVAREPHGSYHFHRGPTYAATFLGYDPDELGALPRIATERFAGVGNPLAIGAVWPGETVLDHACGAGIDLLLAARRVGPHRSRDRCRHDPGHGRARPGGGRGRRQGPRQRPSR
jgi:hypothetical protein